jgi:hypothetical protein
MPPGKPKKGREKTGKKAMAPRPPREPKKGKEKKSSKKTRKC